MCYFYYTNECPQTQGWFCSVYLTFFSALYRVFPDALLVRFWLIIRWFVICLQKKSRSTSSLQHGASRMTGACMMGVMIWKRQWGVYGKIVKGIFAIDKMVQIHYNKEKWMIIHFKSIPMAYTKFEYLPSFRGKRQPRPVQYLASRRGWAGGGAGWLRQRLSNFKWNKKGIRHSVCLFDPLPSELYLGRVPV